MTPRQKLSQIVQTRKWYGDLFSRSTASSIKRRVLNTNPNDGEQISNDKIIEVLTALGYEQKQPESW